MITKRKPRLMRSSKPKKRLKRKWLKRRSARQLKFLKFTSFVIMFAVVGSVWLFLAGADSDLTDIVITDPAAKNEVWPIGRTRNAQWGDITGLILSEQFTNRKVVHFRDAVSGATSFVSLPVDTLYGWSDVSLVMSSPNELWVMGGTGPLYVRQYILSGSPLPTSATLVSKQEFGNSDSRPADMIRLTSGRLVVVWHQQAETTAASINVSYYMPGAQWVTLPPITEMGSMASKQVLAQHPSDNAVWMFNSTDAFGTIGAARYIEDGNLLIMTMSDPRFITETKHDLNGPDPENPFLAAAVDTSSGTIRLAYQSQERKIFEQGTDGMVGSRVAVASIAAVGSISFAERAPVWAERVMSIGMVVVGSDTYVSYQPVDATNLTANTVEVIKLSGGVWGAPVLLGTKHNQTYRVTYSVGRPEFSIKLADNKIHFFTFQPTQVDATFPSVSLTSPANGSTVSGTINLNANSTDNVGVSYVEFIIDGNIISTDTTSPYSFAWNTTKVANGSHSLTVKAYDAANNISTSPAVSVTVKNNIQTTADTITPSVAISSPLNNSIVKNRISIISSGTDNIQVIKMELFVDGNFMTNTNSNELNYSWDTRRTSKGQHTIQVKAWDQAGNSSIAQVVVTKR